MSGETPDIRFSVLGPLRIVRGSTELELNAPMQRRLLIRLLIDRNNVVSRDRLQDALWPGADVDKTSALGFHISKLRDIVDPDRDDLISTEAHGYRARVADEQLDAVQFVGLVDRAAKLIESEPGGAEIALDEALAMWAGTPYADAEFDDFARSEIIRLEETRLLANELRMQALLNIGRHEKAVVELEALVREHPLREKLRELQMVALYRSGRQAEALRAYAAAKETLGDELGIDPTPGLAELEEKILLGEAELLKAPAAFPSKVNTVPLAATALIGRVEEIATIKRMAEASRIITLTGVGGVGKTRLAQAFASEEDQGFEAVWWVGLAGLNRDGEVVGVVSSAVGAGVGSDSSASAVVEHLRKRRALLVLDNCEQVVSAVSWLASEIRDSCPGITILVTSRRSLRLKGEGVLRIGRLELPDEGANNRQIAMSESVAFMLSVAQSSARTVAREDLRHVASIVRRLDGNPLAIELAVARLYALTPAQLDERLTEGFDSLGSAGSDELDHRRTMTTTIQWSVGLLSESGQTLFSRLGVFAGGASLEAVEEVCSDQNLVRNTVIQALEELVDASLVETRDNVTGRRFELAETIAEHARAELSASDLGDGFSQKHAEFFAEFSGAGYEQLIGMEQLSYLARFRAEEANLRSALDWSMTYDPSLAIEIIRGLGQYLFRTGKHNEARRLIEDLVEKGELQSSAALADVFGLLSYLKLLSGDLLQSRSWADRQVELAQAEGAFTAQVRGDYTESTRLWAEGETFASVDLLSSAIDELGPRSDPLAVYMLRGLGRRHIQLGYWDSVASVVSDIRWWADHGHPAAAAALAEINGSVAYFLGDLEQADKLLDSAASDLVELSADYELAEVLTMASNVALARGDWDRSTRSAIEALRLARRTFARGVESQALSIFGNALLRSGRAKIAKRNLAEAIKIAVSAPARVELVWAVSYMAAHMSMVGAAEPAVILYTAASEAGNQMGLIAPANLTAYREKDLKTLGSHLGTDRFEILVATGQTTPLGDNLSTYINI